MYINIIIVVFIEALLKKNCIKDVKIHIMFVLLYIVYFVRIVGIICILSRPHLFGYNLNIFMKEQSYTLTESERGREKKRERFEFHWRIHFE